VAEIKKDGVQILNLTSQDTQNGGAGTIDTVRLQGSTDVIVFDDLYILNATGTAPQNTFLGDSRVDASTPLSDGTTTSIATVFPAAPATHFDKVDEIPPDGDSSYVSTSVSNELDLYNMTPLLSVEGATSIYGVQLNLYAKKDNEGGRQVLGKVRPTSTNFDGAVGTLITTYKYFFSLFDENPQTAADWTEAEKNAAQFGAEVL